MAQAQQSTANFKGDQISVKMFKNADGSQVVDDWDVGTETGTDNTTGIQAALDTLVAGQTLFFPGGGTGKFLITDTLVIPRGAAGLKGITIKGSDKLHCQILYVGTSVKPCVINMIGCDSVTWKDIAVLSWSDDVGKMPLTNLMLGRYPNADAYGHHNFERVGFLGNTSFCNVYSIASEENAWRGCNFFLNSGKNVGGTALINFYTSYKDDAGICSPAVTTESNLDAWFSHCHFVNFAPVADHGNRCVKVQMYAGSGDMVFRDCYMSPSWRTAADWGYAFEFVADPANPFSGSNYVVEAIRLENAEGMFYLAKGAGAGIITGLRFKNNTVGISTGYAIYAEDGTTVSQSTFHNNFPVAPNNTTNISLDYCERIWVDEDFAQNVTVRNIAARCYFHLSSDVAVLSLGIGSFNNLQIIHNKITMNGPIQSPTIDGTLEIDATVLGGVTALIKDASGATTGKVIECRTNAGTPYFAIYGGTDAGFPGTVQTKDILPLANITQVLGNAGLIWLEMWLKDLRLTNSTAHGVLIGQGANKVTFTTAGTAGQVLTSNGAGVDPSFQAASGGTVTSVALTVPGFLSISGSPITTSGTLAVTLATESANTVFAGPSSGGAATPTFRALALADLPASILLSADSSGSYTLTTSYADVPGVTVTATRTGIWLVGISVNFGQNTLDTNLSAQLVVAGSAQSNPITLFSTNGDVLMGSRQWVVTANNGDVIKLQAKKNSGTGTSNLGAQTNIVAEWKP